MTLAPFVYALRVRYAECDPQQIVFNANYFAYFDVAMTELWRAAIGHYAAMLERGQTGGLTELRRRLSRLRPTCLNLVQHPGRKISVQARSNAWSFGNAVVEEIDPSVLVCDTHNLGSFLFHCHSSCTRVNRTQFTY